VRALPRPIFIEEEDEDDFLVRTILRTATTEYTEHTEGEQSSSRLFRVFRVFRGEFHIIFRSDLMPRRAAPQTMKTEEEDE